MFKLQVKFPGEEWAPCVWPARDRIAAEVLLKSYQKHWKQYEYRLVEVTA